MNSVDESTEPEPARPRPLKPGDRVALVAPASPVPADRLAEGIACLGHWGLEVAEFPLCRAGGEYLSGDDEARADELNAALADPSFAAVLAARGGYGMVRIASRLAFPHRQPPLLAGFSDISLLLALALERAGWASLHAPNVATLAGLEDEARNRYRDALFGREPDSYEGLRTVNPGRATGTLLPMNLSILASVQGTPFFPSLDGRILVVEDVGEVPYRVDRLLMQLAHAPGFAKLSGLVFGDLDGAGKSPLLHRHVAALARDFNLPCAASFPIGHIAGNLPVPVGVPAGLDADAGVVSVDKSLFLAA